MINEMLRFIYVIVLITLTIIIGFVVLNILVCIVSFFQTGIFYVPFLAIIRLSVRVGFFVGGIAGVGIWLIYRFNLYRHR